MGGEAFFHGAGRGGEGQGQKSMGRSGAGSQPLPTVRGGAGNMLRVSADAAEKEILICIA